MPPVPLLLAPSPFPLLTKMPAPQPAPQSIPVTICTDAEADYKIATAGTARRTADVKATVRAVAEERSDEHAAKGEGGDGGWFSGSVHRGDHGWRRGGTEMGSRRVGGYERLR
ncbi:hypothetical protein PsYK624_156490 [Phanerochaete sordida]|uniref:Uncharacterized protein n=1 Tax=Phanerochaete sordida TaxID=48140 RepID=A0A9P3GPM9_9APHY|nr:hypothetical protein PsYK624_156490 [Phanerochaete sordida]